MQKPAGNANASPHTDARLHANPVRLTERATPAMPTGNTNAEPYRHANRYANPNPAPTSHRHANAASHRNSDANGDANYHTR